MVKSCPRCGAEHSKRGMFCSQRCGNVRSPESVARQAAGRRRYYAGLSPECRMELSRRNAAGGRGSKEGVRRAWEKKFRATPWDELSQDGKKRRVLEEQCGVCAGCGTADWRGRPLTFELEHKDGDRTNNTRANLEVLCPNCHSQTPTWRGRGIGRGKKNIPDSVFLEAIDTHGNIGAALESLKLNRSGWNRIRAKMLLAARSLTDKASVS